MFIVLPLVSSKRAFFLLYSFPINLFLDREYFLAPKILVGNNFNFMEFWPQKYLCGDAVFLKDLFQ